jgi:hypothetical protein
MSPCKLAIWLAMFCFSSSDAGLQSSFFCLKISSEISLSFFPTFAVCLWLFDHAGVATGEWLD